MNVDHIFQIGSSHIVCEDYALSGTTNKIGYAIISDGCSASPNVDLGARILAHSARDILLNINDDNILNNAHWFGYRIINKASSIFNVLPLHPQTLDATLIVAWVKDKQLTAYLYGDGIVIHKSKDGLFLSHVHYPSNCPDYLSYYLDNDRKELYLKELKNEKKEIVVKPFTDLIPGSGVITQDLFEPVVFKKPVEEGDIIVISSDGIDSFKDINNENIDWLNIVNEFTGFKSLNGNFVVRRIEAFKRQCLKDGTKHYDDISVAAIVV